MATISCHTHHNDNVKAGFCIDLDMQGARPLATPPIFVYKAYIHIIDSLYLIIYSIFVVYNRMFYGYFCFFVFVLAVQSFHMFNYIFRP